MSEFVRLTRDVNPWRAEPVYPDDMDSIVQRLAEYERVGYSPEAIEAQSEELDILEGIRLVDAEDWAIIANIIDRYL